MYFPAETGGELGQSIFRRLLVMSEVGLLRGARAEALGRIDFSRGLTSAGRAKHIHEVKLAYAS